MSEVVPHLSYNFYIRGGWLVSRVQVDTAGRQRLMKGKMRLGCRPHHMLKHPHITCSCGRQVAKLFMKQRRRSLQFF